ncbi:MAG: type II secretion system F family protein [Fimbriimonadaceae bacterium]|nr:type II secretion system F family protein [Fimbriimonadaceae bacterium]
MTTFVYKALEPSGRSKEGRIEAADEQAAIQSLAAEGRFVTEIREEKASPTAQAAGDKKGGNASKADVALFMRRMADLAGAGLPLDRVLQILGEQTENGKLSQAAADALSEVRGGLPVSDALAKNPKLFPPVITLSLAAGEASGRFGESAEKLADLLENDVARRSQVVSALVYPGVLTATSLMVVVFLLTFVVPRLSTAFADNADLPAPTRILMSATDVLTNNWLALLIGLGVGLVLLRGFLATEAGQIARDRFILGLPIFGPLQQKIIVSRYARVLGTLVFGGVPILEALHLAGLAGGSKIFEAKSRDVEAEVREGVSIAQAMKDTGVFPPVLTHMVAIGEETGDLPRMLGRVSNTLDFEVETGLRRLTSLLEPIIILAMGGFVAFVVLSVMLPIFQAQEMVR